MSNFQFEIPHSINVVSNVINNSDYFDVSVDANKNFRIEDLFKFVDNKLDDEELDDEKISTSTSNTDVVSADIEEISNLEIIDNFPLPALSKEGLFENLNGGSNDQNMFLDVNFEHYNCLNSFIQNIGDVEYINDFENDSFLNSIDKYNQKFSCLNEIYQRESTGTTLCSWNYDDFNKSQFPIDDTIFFENDIQFGEHHVAVSNDKSAFYEDTQNVKEIEVDEDNQELEFKQSVESKHNVSINPYIPDALIDNESTGDADSGGDAIFQLDVSSSDFNEDYKNDDEFPEPKIRYRKTIPNKVVSKRATPKTVPLRRFGGKTVPYISAPNTIASNSFGYKTIPAKSVSLNKYGYKVVGSKNNKFGYKTVPSRTMQCIETDKDFESSGIGETVEEIRSIVPTEKRKEKNKVYVSEKAKNQKRQLPAFIIDEGLFSRLSNYWNTIYYGSFFQNLIKEYSNFLSRNDITLLNPELYKNAALATLLPNYASIKFFNKYQGVDGWTYEINSGCKNRIPAMRWTGQKLNFYDFYILRYKRNVKQSKQALCPYCPLNELTNLDDIFHTTHNSHYSHHLGNNHGVYSVGYEMLPPLIGTKNGVSVTLCPDCYETFKLNLNKDPDQPKSILTTYFRHNYKVHNKPKCGRSEKQLRIDNAFFNSDKSKLIYEKFNF